MAAGFFGSLGPRYFVGRPQFPAGLAYPYKAWPGYGFPFRIPMAPRFNYIPAPFSFAPAFYPPSPFGYGFPAPFAAYGQPFGQAAPFGQPAFYPYISGWSPWTAGYSAGYPVAYAGGYPAVYPGYSGGYQSFWVPPLMPAGNWSMPSVVAPVGVVRPVTPLGYQPYGAGARTAAPTLINPGLPAAISPAVTAVPAAVAASGSMGDWQRARDESGQWVRGALN